MLDARLPDLNGLDLQVKLSHIGSDMPVIFITRHGDIPMSVPAIEFLSKPFKDQDLLHAIQHAIERDKLAIRERVVSGLANKVVPAQLGTTEKTIKVHRGQVMRKMKAKSLEGLNP